jgi:hypothetical protein
VIMRHARCGFCGDALSSANCKHNPVIDLDSINKKNTKNYQTCHLSGIINFNHVRMAWVILAILFSAQVLFSKEISFFSLILINYSINQQRW